MESGYFEIWILKEEFLVHYQISRIPVSSLWSVAAFANTDIVFATEFFFIFNF